ncbi:hypothetical protein ABI59_09905 [Acidobacteria bacterium Mor1]|nr:hypothetical protein ABI59_09905 [Acidobacteria bacterium Mor1]
MGRRILKVEATAMLALAISMMSLVSGLATPVAADDDSAWVREIRGPQYFALSVEDVDRSVAWYRNVLGLQLLDDTRDEDGRWRIANLANDALFVEIIWDRRDSAAESARGIVKVGFSVPDVEAVADRVAAAGEKRPRVLTFKRHNVRLVQLRDPDGNILQLTTPIGTAPAPEGS